MEKQNNVPVSNLWRVRRSNNLELKQVAKLLGQQSTNSLSRYENSHLFPNLKTAVKLMMIYKTDFQELFPNLFDECRTEIEDALQKNAFIFSHQTKEILRENIHFCTFEDLLIKQDSESLKSNDKQLIHNHLTKLARKWAYL